MGDALFVADDPGPGEPGGDLADRPGVVEVNVGQKNVVQPRDTEGVQRGEQLTGGGGGTDIHEKRRPPPDEPGADEIGETVQGRGEGYHEDVITEGSNVGPHGQHLRSGKAGQPCHHLRLHKKRVAAGDAFLIGNEVSPLWEWLPATIIAARRRSHRKHTTSLEAG